MLHRSRCVAAAAVVCEVLLVGIVARVTVAALEAHVLGEVREARQVGRVSSGANPHCQCSSWLFRVLTCEQLPRERNFN